jgi:hypothetical protein
MGVLRQLSMRAVFALALASALLGTSGCSSCGAEASSGVSDAMAGQGEPEAQPSELGMLADPNAAPSPRHDLLAALPGCEMRHRGLVIDLGGDGADSRRGFGLGPYDEAEPLDRRGALFTRLTSRKLELTFWLDEPMEAPTVSARVHGGAANRAAAYIDGKVAGSTRITRGETQNITFSGRKERLEPGRHTVLVRWLGGAAAKGDTVAEVDWVRLAGEGTTNEAYSAPTLVNVVSDVVLDAKPKRALTLRAPGAVRCPMRLGPNAELRLSLGFWGNGKGEARVRLLRDGEAPVELGRRKLTGGGGATWLPLTADLGAYVGQLVTLELEALSAASGGRVAFGEPVVARSGDGPPHIPETKTAVLVIVSSVNRQQVPPYGPAHGLSSFSELARNGVAFAVHRTPTTVPAGAVASMLTGLGPIAHGVTDQASRLPADVQTLSEVVKQAGGRTAMFTGAPTTFAPFGFAAGWDHYEMLSPVQDLSAGEPYSRAARWLDAELRTGATTRRLLVVHARGAHPPWDLTKEEMDRLKPEEYGGILDARRGGIAIGKVRTRRLKVHRKLEDEDWTRLGAFERVALVKQSAAFGEILTVLQRRQEFGDALVILAGDVGPGSRPEVPYEPAGELSEDRLLVPLLVKFPGGRFAGTEVATPTTSIDVAATILEALRLKAPEHAGGLDLYAIAGGGRNVHGRVLIATVRGAYSARQHNLRLSAELGKVPFLCQLDVDPACIADVFDRSPLSAPALWQWTFEDLTLQHTLARRVWQKNEPRELAGLDADTAAALTVWGDLQ